jgi:F-type H+-transporting ATPase subunit gamma
MRLKSIKNIEKITKTMKIVASTRLGKAQKAMSSSRVYQEADLDFFKIAETQLPEGSEKTLIIAITSDKGLCGSIHSQMGKKVKAAVIENPNADIAAIGDKTKLQVLRSHADKLVMAFNGVGKETPSFNEASLIVDELAKLGSYDKVVVLYNKFTSSVSFEPSAAEIYSQSAIDASAKLATFDIEDDNGTTETLARIALTNAVFAGMAEGYASEISARRNAMDNASKNAGDMINKYSILYNRTRQAVITNELVDIITGASSLD